MNQFIEIFENDVKTLVNLANVIQIYGTEKQTRIIMMEDQMINANESYEEIKKLIKKRLGE